MLYRRLIIMLCPLLATTLVAPVATGEVAVKVERLKGKTATPEFKFAEVPSLSDEDAGQDAQIELIEGKAGYSLDARALIDGAGPAHSWDVRRMFSLSEGNPGGRVRMDLGSPQPVLQVNTFSWHDGDRAPQVYTLYGSDGTSAQFIAAPRRGVDPVEAGWVKIAAVDTRPAGFPQADNGGGQYAVSVSNGLQPIGKYRYLLWDLRSNIDRGVCPCAYAEFDVVLDGQRAASRQAKIATKSGKIVEGPARLEGDSIVVTPTEGSEQRLAADEVAGARFGSAFVQQSLPQNGIGLVRGLRAEYFAGRELTNLKMVRYDPAIHFSWMTGPDADLGREYSVRWTGQVLALTSGPHRFATMFDGGVRLFIDGQKIIDAWDDKPKFQYTGTTNLEAGRKYDFRFEVHGISELKHASRSHVRVYMSDPGHGQLFLGSDRLFPPKQDAADAARIRLVLPPEAAWLGAPASVPLEAVISNGVKPKSVEFFTASNKIAASDAPPYKIGWDAPPPGYHAITARAVDAAGLVICSPVAYMAIGGKGDGSIPSPWGLLRIGAPATDVGGFKDGTFSIEAHGGMLHGTGEACSFITQPLDGDGQITCRVKDFPKDQLGWAGLMLRESPAPDSLGVTFTAGKDGARLTSRNERGGYMNVSPVNRIAPCYLRLTRRGSIVRAFASDDAIRWVPVSMPVPLTLPRRVYVGMVAVAQAEDEKLAASFDKVEIVSPLTNEEFIGPGLLTRGGSLLSGEVKSATTTEVVLIRPRGGELKLPLTEIARIYFRQMPIELLAAIETGHTGVVLASGDFFEGEFRGVKENRVSIDSVVFGLKSFNLYENTILAAVVGETMPAEHDQVTTSDGSVYTARSIKVADGRLIIEDENAGTVSLSLRAVVEIRRKP